MICYVAFYTRNYNLWKKVSNRHFSQFLEIIFVLTTAFIFWNKQEENNLKKDAICIMSSSNAMFIE